MHDRVKRINKPMHEIASGFIKDGQAGFWHHRFTCGGVEERARGPRSAVKQ